VAKTFDATLKQLVDAFAADWLTFLGPRLGLPPGTGFEPIDADLSTVSPQADKLFRLTAPATGLIHLELQTGPDAELPDRLLVYNVLAHHRHGGPVQSVVLLLRRQANLAAVSGTLRRLLADGRVYHEFAYDVIRVWELPAVDLLNGPLGTLPLAALTDASAPILPAVFAHIDERFRREAATPADTSTLRAALYILLGLRYDQGVIDRSFQGVQGMEDSVTYQAILAKGEARGEARGKTQGRIEEALRLIRLIGEQRFGSPEAAVDTALSGITDPERLERMAGRLMHASDWADLLATP
jgi:predicted transposase YdaD